MSRLPRSRTLSVEIVKARKRQSSSSAFSLSDVPGLVGEFYSDVGVTSAVDPVPFLSGWTYRKNISISRASGVVTNYQMLLLIGESSGASGELVDCGGNVLSSFADLRFTTSDGETLLDYYIESITGTTPNQLATVWVEFDSIGTDATTFYMYYGNAGASAYSNGANTFISFDEFERGVNFDEVGGIWTEIQGSAEISTQQEFNGTRSMLIYGGASAGTKGRVTTPLVANDNVAIRLKYWKLDSSELYFVHGNGTSRIFVDIEPDEDLAYFDGAQQDTGVNTTHSNWHTLEVRNIRFASALYDIYHDGVLAKADAGMNTSALFTNLVMLQDNGPGGSDEVFIDPFIIRNFRTVEPVFGAWGVEQIEGTLYVSQWADQSEQGNNGTQSVGAKKLLFIANQQNGYPAIYGEGIQYVLLASNISLGSLTIFFVADTDNHTASCRIIKEAVGGTDDTIDLNSAAGDKQFIVSHEGGGGIVTLNTSPATPQIYTMQRLVNTGIFNVRQNGSLVGSLDSSETGPFDIRVIGDDSATDDKRNIYGVLIYNIILSESNMQLIEAFLNTKYAIY